MIGGGIVGCATAFFASRAGLDVVLLEKRAALCTLTTPASTGAFRLQFDNAEEIALVREGIELFDAFAEVAGLDRYDLGIRKQGYLFCATSDAGAAHQRHFVTALHAGVSRTSSSSTATRRGIAFRTWRRRSFRLASARVTGGWIRNA